MSSGRLGSSGCRRAIAIAIAAAACLSSPPAPAQAPPSVDHPAAGPRAGVDAAVDHAARARRAYERGDFREAIRLYTRARELRPDPTLLFNLARCHEALATLPDLEQAVAEYEAYLRERPDSADRAAVERRGDALREQIRVLRDKARPAPVVAPSPAAPPPIKRSPVPWILAGVGAGGLIAGITVGALAVGKRSDAAAEPSAMAANDLESSARGLAAGANVAFVAGGSLMVAGAIWGLIDLIGAAPSPARAVAVSVGLGSLQVTGRF